MPREVPSSRYDEAYFLSDNVEGYAEFREGRLSLVKEQQLELLELAPGLDLLEIGFGRGELLARCASAGVRATGVDYAAAAVRIGRATVPSARLARADARRLPFADGSFHRVLAGDVIEHVGFADGVALLREARRILRPGGMLLVHTAPNRLFMRCVYPLARPLLRRRHPDTVEALEAHRAVNRTVHVHEYGLWSLRRAARRAGLDGAETWIAPDVLRSGAHRHTAAVAGTRWGRLVAALGRWKPARFWLGNDLYLRYRA